MDERYERYEYGRDQEEDSLYGGGGPSSGRRRRRRGRKDGFLDGLLVGILATVFLAVLVAGGVTIASLGGRGSSTPGKSGSLTGDSLSRDEAAFNQELENKLSQINRLVDDTFIFEVDRQQMMDSMLAGYLEGLDDVYSVYYTPEEYAETMSDSDGSYVGIGVAVQQDPDTNIITAMTVYSGSPAEEGGMLKGDVLVAVDGEDVTRQELSEVVSKIRGEEGTQVQVTVSRDGELVELTMTRRSLDKVTVEYRMLEEKIGYLKLTEFDSVSVSQVKNAITDLRAQGMERLILDLRDNPGGLLTSVVAIADFFLPEANIFYVEDKQGNKTTYDSTAEQFCEEPLVVLINGNSASASEVLAGTLKDNERAVLVGAQSFGKGIVQTFYQLNDGSGVKLTTAHYFTPKGTDIHGIGIEPDVKVEAVEDTEADEQLDSALKEIRGE